MPTLQLAMRSKEMSKQIATRLSRLRLKEKLDVDAATKTAVCMNHLEEKRDKSVWERLHLFISRVLLDSSQAALADWFSFTHGSESVATKKILATKPFEKVPAT